MDKKKLLQKDSCGGKKRILKICIVVAVVLVLIAGVVFAAT